MNKEIENLKSKELKRKDFLTAVVFAFFILVLTWYGGIFERIGQPIAVFILVILVYWVAYSKGRKNHANEIHEREVLELAKPILLPKKIGQERWNKLITKKTAIIMLLTFFLLVLIMVLLLGEEDRDRYYFIEKKSGGILSPPGVYKCDRFTGECSPTE